MSFPPFAARQPSDAHRLPATLMTLDDWAVTRVTGPDAEKYLQGQLTADVAALTAHQHLLCGHCDAKGKMWSNLRLFRNEDAFAFILRRSLRDDQLTALKKYAVFSKVALTPDDNSTLLGLAGTDARAQLTTLFSHLPDEHQPAVQAEGMTLLWFALPTERFILIGDTAQAEHINATLGDQVERNNSQQWLALDIEAGLPIIDHINSAQFIPQATNLQALGGISFRKGCYTGQEMVARAKFRGANKRALWLLTGHATRVPEAGEELEMQLGENWRRTGSVLASVRLDDDSIIIQAVMNSDLAADSLFRVRDDISSVLTLRPLPYSLEEP